MNYKMLKEQYLLPKRISTYSKLKKLLIKIKKSKNINLKLKEDLVEMI